MDSKEALELLITFLKPKVWKDGFEIRNLKTGEAKTMDEIVDILCEDLEVLEMLKKNMSIKTNYNENDFYCKTFEYITYNGKHLITRSQEEFDRLKYWIRKEKEK